MFSPIYFTHMNGMVCYIVRKPQSVACVYFRFILFLKMKRISCENGIGCEIWTDEGNAGCLFIFVLTHFMCVFIWLPRVSGPLMRDKSMKETTIATANIPQIHFWKLAKIKSHTCIVYRMSGFALSFFGGAGGRYMRASKHFIVIHTNTHKTTHSHSSAHANT